MGKDTREVVIKTERIQAGKDWLTKEDVAEQERRSRKFWDSVDDPQRQAILVLVRDSLLRLVEDPEVWVPTSLEPRSGERVDLWVSIHMSEVDEEVLRRRLETERQINDSTKDLVLLKDEFKHDHDGEDDDATAA